MGEKYPLICYAGQWKMIEVLQIQEVQTGRTLKSGISSLENHGCVNYLLVTLGRVVISYIIIFGENTLEYLF